jgi:hypothetical protein
MLRNKWAQLLTSPRLEHISSTYLIKQISSQNVSRDNSRTIAHEMRAVEPSTRLPGGDLNRMRLANIQLDSLTPPKLTISPQEAQSQHQKPQRQERLGCPKAPLRNLLATRPPTARAIQEAVQADQEREPRHTSVRIRRSRKSRHRVATL